MEVFVRRCQKKGPLDNISERFFQSLNITPFATNNKAIHSNSFIFTICYFLPAEKKKTEKLRIQVKDLNNPSLSPKNYLFMCS